MDEPMTNTTLDGDEIFNRTTTSSSLKKEWIRGVNLGGWLLLERFITPYLFAITDCDLRGDFRQFHGQIDAPPVPTKLSALDAEDVFKDNTTTCKPVLPYPVDEYTLASAFDSKALARAYLQRHWEHFVTYQDLVDIKESGLDHVRVPLSHWILGGDTILPGEPWVDGGWPHFVRVVKWCRELELQVWPDVHTAPGSQNGFDNSGQLLDAPSGKGWSDDPDHVKRSVDVVRKLVNAIKDEGLDDVITGLGPLNEPFLDVPMSTMREFDDTTFDIIREGLNGPDTAVYIGDLFNSTHWNDGFWTDPNKYQNTYLDSHYYHVFAEEPRALSPRQHIAYVCRYHTHYTTGCCYQDQDKKSIPSQGISRIIGEWSASFDTLVVDKLTVVMDEIAKTGKALEFDREISSDRQKFLRNFVEAQMVAYEAASVGVSSGWFFWTFKTEGGAFAEWDYLRGIREGWIPKTERGVASVDRFGTCEDIIFKTSDDTSIVHEFPDPSTFAEGANWQGVAIDDDLVVSHGQSLLDNKGMDDDEFTKPGTSKPDTSTTTDTSKTDTTSSSTTVVAPPSTPAAPAHSPAATSAPRHHHIKFFVFVFAVAGMFMYRFGNPFGRRSRHTYHSLDGGSGRGPMEMSV